MFVEAIYRDLTKSGGRDAAGGKRALIGLAFVRRRRRGASIAGSAPVGASAAALRHDAASRRR